MQPSTDAPAEAITRLDALADERVARGWIARLHTPLGQIPSLYVQNPDPGAAMLCDYGDPGLELGLEPFDLAVSLTQLCICLLLADAAVPSGRPPRGCPRCPR